MKIEKYEQEVLRTTPPTASPQDTLILGALGLGGESGEVIDAIKKAAFHGHTLDEENYC